MKLRTRCGFTTGRDSNSRNYCIVWSELDAPSGGKMKKSLIQKLVVIVLAVVVAALGNFDNQLAWAGSLNQTVPTATPAPSLTPSATPTELASVTPTATELASETPTEMASATSTDTVIEVPTIALESDSTGSGEGDTPADDAARKQLGLILAVGTVVVLGVGTAAGLGIWWLIKSNSAKMPPPPSD
jgi:hypothetical protein